MYPTRRIVLVTRLLGVVGLCLSSTNLFAQPDRITQPIDDAQRFTIPGTLPPLALPRYDQGPLGPSLKLPRLTLVMAPSDPQAAELDQLLADLHDPSSKNYRNWLTPEAYAGRFGLSEADIAKVVEWLTSKQLAVSSVAQGRNAITVTGTVDRIQSAFQTEIHTYMVGGEVHYANATEPSLPAAFQGIVLAIHGLHDFRLRPQHRMSPAPLALDRGATPKYTAASDGKHYLAPDDFATIFNVKPLYNAGIDGSHQSIVIVGQSEIDASHLGAFRSYFGLGDASLTTILVGDDPGYSERDAQESDLDLEWASGIARNASLQFVYASDVTDAVQYAIDQNLAPVISMSYGGCEPSWSKSDALALQTWAKQGNTQGITWIASSGDSGADACYYYGGPNNNLSASVNMPASLPQVTAIGGTEFDEGNGAYWNKTNDSGTKASAQSYIPETSWNDSSRDKPASTGGGASRFFSKPSWQTGTGMPSGDARYVPDLAFPASAQHDGYMVYTSSGIEEGWYIFGGTSAGAPSFAGILALLNQYQVANGYQSNAGLGNVNTRLCSLAQSSSAAFHDTTTGNNTVTATCILCSSSPKSVGYSAASGYDPVTGLGSLDVDAFFAAWNH